jgi:hypothetical protein
MDVQASLPVIYEQQSRHLPIAAKWPPDRGRPLQPVVASGTKDVVDVIGRGNGLHELPAVVQYGRNLYLHLSENPALAGGRIIDLWV